MTLPAGLIPRISLLLFPFLVAGVPGGADTGFGDPPDYHESMEAPAKPGLEASAWKALRAALGGKGFTEDGALILAARDLVTSVHAASASGGGGMELDPRIVEYVMLGRGVTDVVVRPYVASGTSASIVLESWKSHLEVDAPRYSGRIVGLGADEVEGSFILAALAVERHVELEPLERSIDVEGDLVLSGKKKKGVKNLRVLVSTPSGKVLSPAVKVKGSAFDAVLVLEAGEGVYMVEVVGDIGYGPRVLNLFPVTVGKFTGTAKVVLSVPWRSGPSRNAWMLFDLVQADRAQRGLGPLVPDHDLAQVALAHCRDMRDGGFFGHISPAHGGIVERTAHLDGLDKVAEVIAQAPTPQRAFGNLTASPAHAASLHDPVLTHMGVGKVKTVDGMIFTVVLATRSP